jgi:transaldolase
MKNPAQQLIDYGQSVWYDNISRELLISGKLKQLLSEWGIRGLTSNPTIFDNAIRSSSTYDADIATLKTKTDSVDEIFQDLAISDIAQAADLLLPLYNQSNGDDGFVSIEVSPLLARDAEKTLQEAMQIHKKLNRPNVMIKIPATPECIPAIETCLAAGISINVTLIFSVENYAKVANAYCKALTTRAEKGLPIDKIRSVASFFVSRVDGVLIRKFLRSNKVSLVSQTQKLLMQNSKKFLVLRNLKN